MSEQLVKASATWMAQAIRHREVSAVELFDAHAARIAERDPQVNALVIPRLDEARAEAVEADAALARGEHLGPLHGVPFTAKEPIAAAGMPSPNGSRLFADHVDDADAVPLRRLRDAGAILLGKTNVPEFCAHWDTYNELFGATGNPHDVTRSAGGSSGGEAAALASAMTPLGLGSDYGGSIRCPAHFCGVLGLRPGRDTVPWADHHPMVNGPGPRMMASVGPMARCVDDLELALAVLAPLEPAVGAPTGVAVFEEDGLQPVAAACRAAVRRAADALGDAGHDVVESRPPGQAEVRAAFDTVLVHEAASGMLAGPGRPRGRALAADPRDARGAARLRARAGALPRRVRAAAGPGARGRRVARAPRRRAVPGGARRRAAPARELRSGGRGAGAPGRQAHAVHVRQRARPAGRGGARGAHDGRAARRRPAHRPPRPRAGAAGAGARARGARSAAGWTPTARRPCSGT